MLVFVDGDNVLGTFHTREVLDSAADATGDVQGWFYGFTCLPDLVAERQPSGIDDGTCCARGTA